MNRQVKTGLFTLCCPSLLLAAAKLPAQTTTAAASVDNTGTATGIRLKNGFEKHAS